MSKKRQKVRKLYGWKSVGEKPIPGWGMATLRRRTSGAGSMAEFPKWASAMVGGFEDELEKIARDMPSFLKQDRSKGAKKIYGAMTRRPKEFRKLVSRYGSVEKAKELAARVAGRQGPPGPQPKGEPYVRPV